MTSQSPFYEGLAPTKFPLKEHDRGQILVTGQNWGKKTLATLTGERPPRDDAARSSVRKLFDDTRMRLVETGTRNRLVHVNRANSRGNVLNIVNERSDDVHAILCSGKAMRFLAVGKDKNSDDDEIKFVDASDPGFDSDRYQDSQLETRLGPDALQKKLLKIAREAQTAEEESGVNILYLALGFMTWFEDKASGLPREAPLVLLPVELVRNARTSTYDIRLREDDVMTNLPLQQRLKDDFGIDLPELEITEDWRPTAYFEKVQEVIAQRQRWRIDADGIQLGFFSFSKLLMYRDLAMDAWPEDALAAHELTRGLLYEGFETEEPLFGPNDRLDDVLPPERLFHVVDADASQAKVIEEVRSGRNLVVQGPPDTGKSQTITNIVAAAAKEGKRVLFLAEKMAALSVVHDRLVKVGLRDVCLELHSRSANKKSVLSELARTITQASAIPNSPADPSALREARDHLNALVEAMHRPIGVTGETPYTVLSRQCRYIGAGHPPPTLDADAIASMSRADERKLLATVARYGTLLADQGGNAGNPFDGTRNLDLQPVDLARLGQVLRVAKAYIDKFVTALSGPLTSLGIEHAPSLSLAAPVTDLLKRLEGLSGEGVDVARRVLSAAGPARLRETVDAGAAWRTAQDDAATIFVDAAFQTQVAHLRAPLVRGSQSFFARWGGAYRSASRDLAGLLRTEMPKSAADRVALVDQLTGLAAMRSTWENDCEYCARTLGDAWRNERTDFAHLLPVIAWCERLRNAGISAPNDRLLDLAGHPDVLASMQNALRETEPVARAALHDANALLDILPLSWGVENFDTAPIQPIGDRLQGVCRRLQLLRRWSLYEQDDEQVCARGPRARGANGGRSRA